MRYIGLPWGWALVRKHTRLQAAALVPAVCVETRNRWHESRNSKAITDFSNVPHTITRNVSSSRMWYFMNIPLSPNPPSPALFSDVRTEGVRREYSYTNCGLE